jgi:RecA-family ATPase
MAATDMTEFAEIIEPIARLLLGEPNRTLSSKRELRYGTRGSLSVDLQKATWFDNEVNQGGGVLDLITRETGLTGKDRNEWMDEHGFNVDGDAAQQSRGKRNGGANFNVVKTYDYVDDAGKLLFQVCRLDPKDFRQRRPDQTRHDGWTWSVRGLRSVPYRLPELTEALAQGLTVFVVEGEKDADNLWRIGLPATCNAGGVGKWRDELNSYFTDADVVVIEDNDPQKKHPKTGEPMFHEDGRPILPGQDHAQAVAAALTGVGARVRVLKLKKFWPEMPLKGDVSDWLKAGNTREQLDALVDQTPTWEPQQNDGEAPAAFTFINILRWHGIEPKPRSFTVPERIPNANVTLLTGEGGIGKTLLMQQLSVATVLGRDWVGSLPAPGPVIFITAEDDEDELHFRYHKIAKHYGVEFDKLTDLHLMSLAGRDAVMAAVNAKGIVEPTELFKRLASRALEIKPRWIGLDTAADIFICDERNRTEVRQCISLLRRLALDVDAAVILLAHPSLAGIHSGSGLSGSTAWNNSVRSRLYLKKPNKKNEDDEDDDDDDPVRILECMKANYSAIAEPVRLVWKDGLLLNEPAQTPMQRASQEANAQLVFLALIERYNKHDLTVSANPTARNFAPKVFASTPEAKALATREGGRKRALREAMETLLIKQRIYVGKGPQGVTPSKQNPCLYAGGSLL